MDRNVLLATTRTAFLNAFLRAVDYAMPRAAANLFRSADASRNAIDQRRMIGAHQLLRNNEAALHQHMMRSMDQLLNRSFQTTYSTFRPSFFSSYVGNDLALLDANLYEDQLHLNELTATFRHAAEEQLRDLNIRIAILFEQDTINERENPFRPFLFARALVTAADNLGPMTEVNTAVSDQLAADMEDAIAEIYTTVNAHLAEHGIGAQLQLKIKKSPSVRSASTDADGTDAPFDEPHTGGAAVRDGRSTGIDQVSQYDTGYRALSSDIPKRKVEQLLDMVMAMAHSQSATTASGNETIPGSAATAGAGWNGAQSMVGSLHKFLYGPAPATSRADTAASRSAAAPSGQSLAGLLQQNLPTGAAMSSHVGGVRNLIFEQRTALTQATGDRDEQMTIDVVAMLFEFILRDSQIPAEVRAQLGRLQFLVLKIALRERALLTQKSHPARMLVNRIGSVSIGLKQLDPSGARVSSEICRIVETLLADQSENSALFETMLDQFDTFIAHELRAGDVNVDRAVQAVENAQSRTLRFAHLTAQLAEALSGLTIDPFLQDFLNTTWVHVIERTEREPTADVGESTRFRQLVPDLLWSILPKPTAPERTELLGRLPQIVGTLREGLTLESWDATRQQVVLGWLVDAHSSAMRNPEGGSPELALASLHRHFENFITHPERHTGLPAAAEQDASAEHQAFLDEALKESHVNVTMLDPLIESADTLESATSAQVTGATAGVAVTDPAEEVDVLDRLRSGVAIEITLGSNPGIGRLNWINQDGSTLVLTMDESNEPSMVSVRMFLRLLALGRVRFIEREPLFERAVQGLLKSAEQIENRA